MEGFPIDLGRENHRDERLAWLDTVFQPAIELDLQWIAAIGAAGADGNGKIFIA